MNAPFNYYNYDEWFDYLEKFKIGKAQKEELHNYLEICKSRNLPFITSFRHLSTIFEIDVKVLSTIISFPEMYYREFMITKKNGKERHISAPYSAMYSIQKWIKEEILEKERIDDHATGFCFGKSIIDNIRPHTGNTAYYKLDLKDFFPSINIHRVISVFKHLGYPHSIAVTLARFCCLDSCLPQGAPTSPILSNIVAKKMDYRINKLCYKYKIYYTRYADDMAFSASYIPSQFCRLIETIVNNEGFTINESKTRLMANASRVIITGISIGSGKPTLPRDKKRLIRTEVFRAQKQDPYILLTEKKDPIYFERLLGRLYFWKFIEPECDYTQKSINVIKDIITSIS